MISATRKEQRELHAVRVRKRRLRKKLLREMSAMIERAEYRAIIPDSSAVEVVRIGSGVTRS